MKDYLQSRLDRGTFLPRPLTVPSRTPYEDRRGWKDYAFAPGVIFSHRSNRYAPADFSEVLRWHGYYEILIPVSGAVDYVFDDAIYSPELPAVFCFPPGCQHAGRLRSEGVYDRFVFYFHPDAFSWQGKNWFPGEFSSRTSGAVLYLSEEDVQTLLDLLRALDEEFSGASANLLQCYALFLRIFDFISRRGTENAPGTSLPEKVVKIREYIDANFRNISSVAEVADRFFYCREHLARLFRRYYNCSVSSYLIRCRLRAGKEALRRGDSVTKAAFDCGFDSLSAFASAFRKHYGMPPSEYRKK